MMAVRYILMLFVVHLLSHSQVLLAQDARVDANLSRNSIRIGEQCTLKFTLYYYEGMDKRNVQWPAINDTLTPFIEVLKQDTISSKLVDHASVLYEEKNSYLITCFDSGTWIIPPQRFIVDSDTVFTDPLELYVNTVPVDTTKPIKDIAGIFDVPPAPEYQAQYKFFWWWLALALVGIAAVAIILYLRRKKKKTAAELQPVQVGHVPLPHEILLKRLNELAASKPWQNGDVHAHYLELSSLMRSWVVERFHLPAHEMTTWQVIHRLRRAPDSGNKISELEHVLKTADLVKFGKLVPDNFISEKCIEHSIAFVESTAFTTVFLPPPNMFNTNNSPS
jgi:hypothetical protein